MKPLIIEQKITAFANQYRVFEADAQGNKISLAAFAHQKRLAMRDKIEFFSDESKTQLSFSAKADKVLDVHGKFIISDATGNPVGALRKSFQASLFRSTWEMLNLQDQPVFIVQERSPVLAIVRRLWTFIPFIGDLPFLLKYHFDFQEAASTKVVASYVKTKLLYDHYKLDVVDTPTNEVDWRVVAAQCVLLDALQGR